MPAVSPRTPEGDRPGPKPTNPPSSTSGISSEGKPGDRYAMDADLTIYWPQVRPEWEEPDVP